MPDKTLFISKDSGQIVVMETEPSLLDPGGFWIIEATAADASFDTTENRVLFHTGAKNLVVNSSLTYSNLTISSLGANSYEVQEFVLGISPVTDPDLLFMTVNGTTYSDVYKVSDTSTQYIVMFARYEPSTNEIIVTAVKHTAGASSGAISLGSVTVDVIKRDK
jgi:hypothetical protein